MDPVTITVEQTKRALSVSHTTVYRLINSGQLETLKIGRRTLITTASIRALVDPSAVAQAA
jgi:excisionase family DNA binding protein